MRASSGVLIFTQLEPSRTDRITPKVNQKIDGRSYAGELLGTKAFDRDTYFIWFPHLVPVSVSGKVIGN